jgi:hypothetical protein
MGEPDKLADVDPFNYYKGGIIACIGDNSGQHVGVRDLSITEGYKTTVDLLYKGLSNKSEFYGLGLYKDTLVYPFWFCCRHALELYLKLAIKRINWIWEQKKIQPKATILEKYQKAIRSHKIKELTELFIDLVDIDNETKNAFTLMEDFKRYLSDYFFDEDSDAFRYTFKQNQQDVNLDGKKIVNISILYAKFTKLYKQLDWFFKCVFADLLQDYQTKTFTKNLNRNQILKISKELPKYTKWNEPEFAEIKNGIKKKYNISSKELTQALNYIQTIPAFSVNIDKEIILGRKITQDIFEEIIELKKIQDSINAIPTKTRMISLSHPEDSYDKNDFEKLTKLKEIFWKKAFDFIQQPKVSHDVLSTLLTFIELGSSPVDGRYFCEDFDHVHKYWDKEYGDYKGNSGKITYIIVKLMNFSWLQLGLERCGQTTYLSWLREHYNKEQNK